MANNIKTVERFIPTLLKDSIEVETFSGDGQSY